MSSETHFEYVKDPKVEGVTISSEIECPSCHKAFVVKTEIPLKEFPRLIKHLEAKIAKSKKMATSKRKKRRL